VSERHLHASHNSLMGVHGADSFDDLMATFIVGPWSFFNNLAYGLRWKSHGSRFLPIFVFTDCNIDEAGGQFIVTFMFHCLMEK